MPKHYLVEAHWDPEAKVWYSSSDIPGLVIEAAALAEFEALIGELAAEMLSDNLHGEAAGARVEWRASRTYELEVS
jgi:hypothetical protein